MRVIFLFSTRLRVVKTQDWKYINIKMGNARNMNARYPDQIDQRNIDAINKGNW